MLKERLDLAIDERYIINKNILKLAQWRYNGTIQFLIQVYVYMYLSVFFNFYVMVYMQHKTLKSVFQLLSCGVYATCSLTTMM